MKKTTSGDSFAFPCLESHVATLAKYVAITGANRNLVISVIILEELETLDCQGTFEGLDALRKFTVPKAESSFVLNRRVAEHLNEVAEAYGVTPQQLVAWCVKDRVELLQESIKAFEIDCKVGMTGRESRELPLIAQSAVRLGVALNRRNPTLLVSIDGTGHSYDGFVCPAFLLNHEIHFLHEEGGAA